MNIPASLFGLALRLMRARSLHHLAETLVTGLVASGLCEGAELLVPSRSGLPVIQRGRREGSLLRFPLAGGGVLMVINPSHPLSEVAFTALLEAFGDEVARWSNLPDPAYRDGSGLPALHESLEGLGVYLDLLPTAPGDHDASIVQAIRQHHANALAVVRAALPDDPTGLSMGQAMPRVLVAEDVPLQQELLSAQLKMLGYGVDIAGDGAEALSAWKTGRHALVLADLSMPVMDGVALAQAIRELESPGEARTIIIAISAASEPDARQRCLESGMDDTLAKPIPVDMLGRVLARWLPHGRAVASSFPPTRTMAEASSDGGLPVFSRAALEANFGRIDRHDAESMLAMFLDAAREGLFRLQLWGMGTSELLAEMHRQKSAARTVGALHYGQLAEALEARARGERWSPEDDVLTPLILALLRVEEEARPAIAGLPETVASGLAGGASSVEWRWRRCLVVDDDPVVREQIQRLLCTLGAREVRAVDGGFSALDCLRASPPWDLLVCDLQMPGLDGIEVLRRLADTGFSGAVVLLSGAQADVLQTAGSLAGLYGNDVLGVLEKPVSAERMAGLLDQAISRGQRQAEVDRLTVDDVLAGIAADEFGIVFQPQVDAHTLAPVGMEALARWRREDGSWVSTAQFVSVAEAGGIIGKLSVALLRKTLAGVRYLRDAGFPIKAMFNLSAQWIEEIELTNHIEREVDAAGLTPSDIGFEITETSLNQNIAKAMDVLTRLRLKGFSLSLDDFGVGYASFEQLRRFPITEIKLDRQFVADAGRDPAARVILESMLQVARRLSLTSVAEGVETEADLQMVRTLGCPKVQGYYFARPMTAAEMVPWMAANARGVALLVAR